MIKKQLVLILPGGGIRGVYQLYFMDRLFKSEIKNYFEIKFVFATSVGALLSPFILTKRIKEAIDILLSIKNPTHIGVPWNNFNGFIFNKYYSIKNKINNIDELNNLSCLNKIEKNLLKIYQKPINLINNILIFYNIFQHKSIYKEINPKFLHEFKNKLNKKEIKEIENKLFITVYNLNTKKPLYYRGKKWKEYCEISASLWLFTHPKKIKEDISIIEEFTNIENIGKDKDNIIIKNKKVSNYLIDGGLTQKIPLIFNDNLNKLIYDENNIFLILNLESNYKDNDLNNESIFSYMNTLINNSSDGNNEKNFEFLNKIKKSNNYKNNIYEYNLKLEDDFENPFDINNKKIELCKKFAYKDVDNFINNFKYNYSID